MSVESPVIASIDGLERRIYLERGVNAFHWITDIYREYLYRRAADEGLKKWFPLLTARGGELKENGLRRESYVVLLHGTRVVPFDEAGSITATGEVLNDTVDQYPFDLQGLGNASNITITLVNPNTGGGAGLISYGALVNIKVIDPLINIKVLNQRESV